MARWTRSERAWAAGCLGAIAVVVLGALLLVANAIAGAPPRHEIHTPGARPVSYQIADSGGRIVRGRTAPTVSLDEFRCEAWRQGGQEVCPDPGQLSTLLWPRLEQAPATLYVGVMWTSCLPSPGYFNVEYAAGTLLLHCFDSRPWFVWPLGGPHYLFAAPSIVLVMVPMTDIPPGRLQVVYEERVERWLFDAVDTSQLGAVNVSG